MIRETFTVIWLVAFAGLAQALSASPFASDRMPAAVPTSKFVKFIGVNVHMGYSSSPYGNPTRVKDALAYLGIDQVRDKLLDWPDVQKNYAALAATGAKFDFLLPAYSGHPNTVNLPEFISMVGAFAQAHPGSVAAVEGPNEVNIWPASYSGGTTLPDQAVLQRDLHAAVRQNKNLNKIPVYNLTLAYTDASQFAQLGNLSHAADYANSHAYPNNAQTPRHSLAGIFPLAKIDAPGLPLVITETGYETNTANAYSGVDQTVQAKLTLDELMDIFAAGISRVYLYELFDEGGENFGLFNADGTPKMAATALHNLTAIVSDPGVGIASSAGSLNYAVQDESANTNELLLKKNDRTLDLILWAESAIWNPTDKSEVVAPTETDRVEFEHKQKNVIVFDPLRGTDPIAFYHDVQSITVNLVDHPIIIQVSPAGGSRPVSP